MGSRMSSTIRRSIRLTPWATLAPQSGSRGGSNRKRSGREKVNPLFPLEHPYIITAEQAGLDSNIA
jgi:hypothetical protein